MEEGCKVNKSILKDDVILGVLAGFAGNILKEIISWLFYFSGYLKYTFVHIAAGTFVSKEYIDSPVSLATGVISDWIMVAVIGVLSVYLIRFTGNCFPVIKSILLSSFFYIILYGVLMAFNATHVSMLTPLPNLLLFIPHLTLGGGIGWFVSRYGMV